MPQIKILPPDVANKIAAGEVVERPASVVKELVENAVDAESTHVNVEIRAGGKRLIRISDNGVGMSREDALIALERHATSKVTCIEDLQKIQTFGFRGEALPSVASVSQFELLTRTAEALEGTKITAEGGIVRSVQESGCSPGTHITVNNLFYNVPARLKFLKSETTEVNHITNQVMWSALAHPKVQFTLTHNGRSLIDVRACESHADRIRLLHGKEFAEGLIEFEEDLSSFHLHCFVGKPELTKANRNYQLFFLNRRPIRSKIIGAALNEAMRSMIPKDRHAIAFLFMTMDADGVDVNVHPAKIEVRFQNERAIYSGVVRTLNKGIYQHKYIPKIETDSQTDTKKTDDLRQKMIDRQYSMGKRVPGSRPSTETNVESAIDVQSAIHSAESSSQSAQTTDGIEDLSSDIPQGRDSFDMDAANQPAGEGGIPFTSQTTIQPPRRSIPDGVGVELLDFKDVVLKTNLFNTYIIAEATDRIFIIDQHVAAERVLYEKYVEQLKNQELPVQGLLLPVTIEATVQQLAILKEHEELFTKLGFDVERFGGNTILVRSIPAPLPTRLAAETVTGLLDGLTDKVSSEMEILDIQDKALITLACKSAVKAGDSLAMEEMVNLVKDLSRAKLPFNCPHARPIIVEMSRNELESRFHRR